MLCERTSAPLPSGHPDFVDRMLAAGCRIGEALALRHAANADGKPLLDLDAKTWEVNATVVRVSKTGLIVQPRPKTASFAQSIRLGGRAGHRIVGCRA